MKIINFKKKKSSQQKSRRKYMKCKNLLYLQKKIENKYLKDKKYCEVGYHCHYTGKYRGT